LTVVFVGDFKNVMLCHSVGILSGKRWNWNFHYLITLPTRFLQNEEFFNYLFLCPIISGLHFRFSFFKLEIKKVEKEIKYKN